MKNTVIIAGMLSFGMLASVVSANDRPPRDGKPPKEAIEACVDKSEGEIVTFETRHGHQLDATCKLIAQQLVAVPEGHKE